MSLIMSEMLKFNQTPPFLPLNVTTTNSSDKLLPNFDQKHADLVHQDKNRWVKAFVCQLEMLKQGLSTSCESWKA